MNLYGTKEVIKMGIMDQSRQMKFVMNKMTQETERLEKKFEIFISNQNDLAKMLATDYELLKVIANKLEIKELPKPLIDMFIEDEKTEV